MDITVDTTGAIIVDTTAATLTVPGRDTAQDQRTPREIRMYTVPRIVPVFIQQREGFPRKEKTLPARMLNPTTRTTCILIVKAMSINARRTATGSNREIDPRKSRQTSKIQQLVRTDLTSKKLPQQHIKTG